MYIVSVNYKVDLSAIDPFRALHMEFLDKYYEKGCFIASGPRVPRTGGVIIANAESLEALNNILLEDPFYTEGLADYDIVEFNPNKYAKDFEVFIE